MRLRTYRQAVLITALVILTVACAARGARNIARVGALTAGELALEVDKQERLAYAGNIPGYDKAAHDKVGAGVLKLLQAERAYERAVAGWPEGVDTVPEIVTTTKAALAGAMTDLQTLLPAIAVVRDPIQRALDALDAFLKKPIASTQLEGVTLAQLPGGGVMAIFALMELITGMLASGRTSYDRLRVILAKEGATDEELVALDTKLSDAIALREAEQPKSPNDNQP